LEAHPGLGFTEIFGGRAKTSLLANGDIGTQQITNAIIGYINLTNALSRRKGSSGTRFSQIQQQTGGTEADFELKRSVDESSIDDLEQDGFQNSKQPKK
jgi:hypothetical protein